jgi:glycosyltransferase involved in cell wall biosynthesis
MAMYRDVERGFGVLDPAIHIFTGGFQLPALTVLSRMSQFSEYIGAGVSPLPISMSYAFLNRGANFSVDLVIPVLNEAHVLEKSVERVLGFLRERFHCNWHLVIIDNGSTDGTQNVARQLCGRHPEMQFLHLTQRGRGRALRHAWLQSRAEVVCYMDVDLSTDLEHLPALIGAIADEGFDVSTGSRLMRESRTRRSFKREVISRIYNVMVKAVLFTRFSDAQCGFKAVSRRAVEQIIPQVVDQSWFFDTELLVLAEKQGYRIKDIPVAWVEDDDSRVKIFKTGWDDIKGVCRMRKLLWKRRPAGVLAPHSNQNR